MPSDWGTLQTAVTAAQEVAGEDPRRYLDTSLVDDRNARRFARSRIRGLEDLNTVRVWRAVETYLERGPRKQVIKWLDERQAELEAYDDRKCFADWLESAPKADTESMEPVARWIWEVDGDIEVSDGTDRGPRVTAARPCLDAFYERRATEEPSPRTTEATETAVATDGGEPQGEDQ